MDKERVKRLIKGLKAALGKDQYADFKATSVQFQTGAIDANVYYASASSLLLSRGHPDLLIETFETLPDEGKRGAVLALHAAAAAASTISSTSAWAFSDQGGGGGRGAMPRPRGHDGRGGRGRVESTMAPPPEELLVREVPTPTTNDTSGRRGAGGGGGSGGGGFHQAKGSGSFAFNKISGDGAGAGAGAGAGGVGNARRGSSTAEVLAPGLICLRRYLDHDTQVWLADTAFKVGESGGGGGDGVEKSKQLGFYETVPGERPGEASVLRLNQGTRGRVILGMDAFPDDKLRQLCIDCVRAAAAADPGEHAMPAMNPTTVLVNFYKEGAQFKWHRDSEDPELARSNRAPPIVSFTVGLSADFAYKRHFEVGTGRDDPRVQYLHCKFYQFRFFVPSTSISMIDTTYRSLLFIMKVPYL